MVNQIHHKSNSKLFNMKSQWIEFQASMSRVTELEISASVTGHWLQVFTVIFLNFVKIKTKNQARLNLSTTRLWEPNKQWVLGSIYCLQPITVICLSWNWSLLRKTAKRLNLSVFFKDFLLKTFKIFSKMFSLLNNLFYIYTLLN